MLFRSLVRETLQDQGVPVARVSARRIRAYAYGLGQQAKTDALDAHLLARYAAEAPVTPSRVRPPLQRQLMDVVDQRRHYVALAAAERSWRAHQPAAGAGHAADLLTALTAVIAALEAELRALIGRVPELQARVDLLTSCPGVGEQTAMVLVTDVPELGEATAKEVAALVGVAPCTSESGQARRAARIQGGRATLRQALWWPTKRAMSCNPAIQGFAARLRATGKSPHQVVIACMRKLLTILNALLTTQTPWRNVIAP